MREWSRQQLGVLMLSLWGAQGVLLVAILTAVIARAGVVHLLLWTFIALALVNTALKLTLYFYWRLRRAERKSP